MDVLMPQLGETVSEGKIIKWFKSVGDAVAAGENLCEIETDKVTVEVPAIAAGVLQRHQCRGRHGRAGRRGHRRPLRWRARQAGPPPRRQPPPRSATAALPPPPAPSAPAPARVEPRRIELDPFREVQTPLRNFGPATLATGVSVTPLARRLAADAGIDLALRHRLRPARPDHRQGRRNGHQARPAASPSLARAETFEEIIGDVHRARPHHRRGSASIARRCRG